MAIDYNSSVYTFFNTTGQIAQTAVVAQDRYAALTSADNGRAAINLRTGEVFEVENARYVKRGQMQFQGQALTPTASVTAGYNLVGFDESNLTKVKQAQAMNSRNYYELPDNDTENGGRGKRVVGTYVYMSTSSSFSSATIPIKDVGNRTPVKYYLQGKVLWERSTSSPSRTSFVMRDTGGVPMYSGRDGSVTRYWYVVRFEYWSV